MANEVEITITATDLSGPAFASALAKMEALKKAAGDISIGKIDANALGSDLMTLRSKLQSIGIADLADINIPPGRIVQQMQFLKRMIGQSGISDIMDLNVNDASLTRQLHKLGSLSETIPVNFDLSKIPNLDKLFGTETIPIKRVFVGNTQGAPSILPTQNMEETFKINGLLQAQAQLEATEYQTKLLADSFMHLETAKDSLANDFESKLTPAVAASGGTGRGGFGWWGGILGGTIGHVAAWHVVLDLAAEGLIAVVGAGAALAVGLAAMAPAASDIYQHLKNLQTISGALNQNIPPLNSNFSNLADSLKPQVVEAYGGALFLLNRNTGAFGSTAHQVATIIDDWIAKIDLWDQAQGGIGGLLKSGTGFLQQFGSILGHVGDAIGNLIAKEPGLVHLLLDVINFAATGVDLFAKLPAPIVATALALHGFYVYGNLASSAAGGFLRSISNGDSKVGKLGVALQKGFGPAVLLSPTGALLGVAAAIAWIATRSEEAQTPTVKFANALINSFNAGNATQALANAGKDIKVFQTDIAQAYSPKSLQDIINYQSSVRGLGSGMKDYFVGVGHNINQVMNDIASGHYRSEITDIGRAFSGLFSNSTNESVAAGAAISAYKAKIATVVGESANLQAVQLALVASGNSWTGALDIMDQAGIKANDSYALMIQKVNNLIGGYQNLGIGAGQDAAMFNAVNYATGQADNALGEYDKSMTSATQAEAQLFGVLIGGQGSMYTFLTSVQQLGNDSKVSGASLNSFNKQSLQLGSDLYTSVLPAAESFINSIQMQGANMKLLVPIVATTAASVLQYTGNNKAAKLAMVDLINGALGPGTVSMQNLKTWVDKNSVSQQQFSQDVYQSQQNASNLAGVLNKNLIPMMNQAFIQASNLGPAMKTWFTDVINGTTQTAAGRQDRLNLVTDIVKSGQAAHLTQGQIENMIGTVLNIPKSEAIQLYFDAHGAGNIYFNESTGVGGSVSGGLKFMAKGGLLPGFGGGDILPAMLEPGETVIDKHKTKQYAALFAAMGVPGFAHGGYVPNAGRVENWMGSTMSSFGRTVMDNWAVTLINNLKATVAKEVAQAKAAAAAAGAAGGSAGANQAIGMQLAKGYGWGSGIQWADLVALWNDESGWNRFATNPSSGAYGIPQALPYTKMPKAAWPASAGGSSNASAQIGWGLSYIRGRWGSPMGALANENAYHWYDDGGWLKPGLNVMMNGTGGWEHLSRDTGRGNGGVALEVSAAGQSAFEQFMIMAIREWVTLKGGGNVQRAFGVPGR